ncbi:MAG: type II secretion system protein [bacterium]
MNNQKGFTLVELLIVIALISVVTTSMTLSMFDMLDSQKTSLEDKVIANIENAACTYAEIYGLQKSCTSTPCVQYVEISKLVKEGMIDDESYDKIEVAVRWDQIGLKTCTY